jgi:hypothetical protein
MTFLEWYFFLALMLFALIVALVTLPVLVVFVIVGFRVGNRHLSRLAAERAGEDIGTFARAFDRRTEAFDPWVVRATWDALEPYVVFPKGRVPLRPTDRLEEDLHIDPLDIHFDLVQEVAERSGRSLDETESNPLFGHVETVGDFVRFITWQPPAA